ncbi:MAG: hypothetical protein IJV31_06545 [Clostridia bacterium]|nr:hypothetical protein [Clostridia bacterium]
MANGIKDINKIIELRNNEQLKKYYIEDVLYINFVQSLTDSIYELYHNLNKHIEDNYGMYAKDNKQKRYYKKLKEHIYGINKYFSLISSRIVTPNVKSGENNSKEAIGNLLLSISDFNVNYIKLFITALIESNSAAFFQPNSETEKLDKLWDVLRELSKDSRVINIEKLEKPSINEVIDSSITYMKTIDGTIESSSEVV